MPEVRAERDVDLLMPPLRRLAYHFASGRVSKQSHGDDAVYGGEMKPIELGCLVMITDSSDSSHVGLCGTAVEMEKDASHLGCYWKVSVTGHFHNQKCLIRIDGGDGHQFLQEVVDAIEKDETVT